MGVRHGRVLAHDVHAPDFVLMDGVHDLDHSESRLGIELRAPELLELGAYRRVIDPLIIGVNHGDKPDIRGPLHVVLAAQWMEPRTASADLAGHKRQGDQTAGVISSMDMLRDPHTPED